MGRIYYGRRYLWKEVIDEKKVFMGIMYLGEEGIYGKKV